MATTSNPYKSLHPDDDTHSSDQITTHTPTMSEPDAAHQLDFYQAMADFRHMFPNMEEEVIEAVLRANNGAVDATIDQLLTLNTDCGTGTATVPKYEEKYNPPEYHVNGGGEMPPPYSRMTHRKSGQWADSPPSYQDYTSSMENSPHTYKTSPRKSLVPGDHSVLLDLPVPAAEICDSSSPGGDLLGATGGLALQALNDLNETTPKLPLPKGDICLVDPTPIMDPPPPPLPQIPDKMPLFNHSYTPSQQSLPPTRLYKKWTPPMVGQLPDDFLRIAISPPANDCHRCHHHHHHSCSSQVSPASPNTTPGRSKGRRSRSNSSSSPRLSAINNRSPRLSPRGGSDELSSELIQQKLAENERKRSSPAYGDSDPAALQVLEDERLALALQNEEFLTELMSDEDFLRTLEKDRMNATAFEPPSKPRPDSPELDPDRPKSEYIEGYGDDRDMTLGAFPFDRTTPRDKKTQEFRRQLSNMGGSSKKKMVAAAKRFFSRKKKPSKQLLKDSTAPSTINLLEEEELLEPLPPGGDQADQAAGNRMSYGKSTLCPLENENHSSCSIEKAADFPDERPTEVL